MLKPRSLWRQLMLGSGVLLSLISPVLAQPITNDASRRVEPPKSDPSPAPPYFANDYREARAKFLGAARARELEVESFEAPVPGPDGAPIYTDVVAMGRAGADRVVMLGSATHGVEGYAGSAVLVGLLRDGIASRLGDEVRVVMIHALNPYGFAHTRRFDQDNVDLNRNFIDHADPRPVNAGYEALANALAPTSNTFLADILALSRFAGYVIANGTSALKRAVTQGQYSHPQGLFYGGHAESWSRRSFREIVRRHIGHARHVAFIDFHTGLGPFGHAEVIMNDPAEAPSYGRAKVWWGDRVKTTKADESVSEDLTGTLKLSLARLLPQAEVTAVSLEFGTLAPLSVLWALRRENWLHHHGGATHPDRNRIKENLLRAFYPDSDDWKARVWEQGRRVAEQAIAGLRNY